MIKSYSNQSPLEIRVSNVSFTLPNLQNPLFQVEDFHFEYGKSYILLGPSGCGKSSFLDFLSGDPCLTTGSLLWRSVDLKSKAKSETEHTYFSSQKNLNLKDHRRYNIARIYQDLNLVSELSVWENAQLELTTKIQLENFSLNLDFLKISHLKKRTMTKLSFGERQRVVVARACAKGAQWILADEPTAHLDPDNTELVMDLLLRSAPSLLMVTHDLNLTHRVSKSIHFRDWMPTLRSQDAKKNLAESANSMDSKKGSKVDSKLNVDSK